MQKTMLAFLTLILVNIFVFGQVYTFEFIGYDDAEFVPANPALEHGLTFEEFGRRFPLTTRTGFRLRR